jgi:hypothetical protein
MTFSLAKNRYLCKNRWEIVSICFSVVNGSCVPIGFGKKY